MNGRADAAPVGPFGSIRRLFRRSRKGLRRGENPPAEDGWDTFTYMVAYTRIVESGSMHALIYGPPSEEEIVLKARETMRELGYEGRCTQDGTTWASSNDGVPRC